MLPPADALLPEIEGRAAGRGLAAFAAAGRRPAAGNRGEGSGAGAGGICCRRPTPCCRKLRGGQRKYHERK